MKPPNKIDRCINWFLGTVLIGAAAFVALGISAHYAAAFLWHFGWI
jgi:hypothetical protein